MGRITDAEIIELEYLTEIQGHYDLLEQLDKANPNYRFLQDAVNAQKWEFNEKGKPVLVEGYAGCILEGSSRSGKTWSGIDLIIWLCAIKHEDEGCTINIYRETYNEFKDTLYDDFKRRLDDYGLPNKFKYAQEIKSFKIGNSKVSFLGDGKHGGGCDYAFFNEAMSISQHVFDQVKMRCRKFWWMDYNPSFTQHWVFDKVESRKDVGFLRTTYEDNPFIAPNELNEILGSEPWETGSYYISEEGLLMYNGEEIDDGNQPPIHQENTENTTADEDYWKVYGLGLRGAMKGTILKKVKYIDEWPSHLPCTYGLDFGFTNDPTALTRYAREGNKVYTEVLIYKPIDNPEDIDAAFTALGMSKDTPITADSADRYLKSGKEAVYMVRDLMEMGWEISKVVKSKRIVYWLNKLKKDTIHVVKNHLSNEFRTEQQNYKWKEINGISINQPIDGFDHAITSLRYSRMSDEINSFGVNWN